MMEHEISNTLVPNRKIKDTLFRRIFSDPKNLLDLYNALNNAHYTDPSALQITTLDNVVYMSMKNDISFLVSQEMNLYEHQSTLNPNMPLRGVFYFARVYQNYVTDNQLDIYGSGQLSLPYPKYVVFYNGTAPMPEEMELRLSNSFTRTASIENDSSASPSLECTALVLNINAGHNRHLMDACRKLSEYAQFIQKIRDYRGDGHSPATAVSMAIDYCTEHDILNEYLSKNRKEALLMILEEYDPEFHMRKEKELSYEQGIAQGREEGKMEGRMEGAIDTLLALVRKGVLPESAAAEQAGMPLEEFRQLLNR